MGINLEPYLNPSPAVQKEANRILQAYQAPIWLSCGRLIYYKGLHIALSALRSVPGTLLIVGDGPERVQLEAAAAKLGVRDRVVFIGNLHNHQILPYYLAATAFWFPSNYRTEGIWTSSS